MRVFVETSALTAHQCHLVRSYDASELNIYLHVTVSMICYFYRHLIKRISVRSHDAHGRFVKTIHVYYSAKPVANLTELKLPEHADQWHKCATLHVSYTYAVAAAASFHSFEVACAHTGCWSYHIHTSMRVTYRGCALSAVLHLLLWCKRYA
jgi:hypothetical protein